MSRPDWCDEGTWEKALAAQDAAVVRCREERFFYGFPTCSGKAVLDEEIARALLSAKREGMETMKPLVERAFRDGLTYGSLCDVGDQDEAWRTSSVRQKAQEIGK